MNRIRTLAVVLMMSALPSAQTALNPNAQNDTFQLKDYRPGMSLTDFVALHAAVKKEGDRDKSLAKWERSNCQHQRSGGDLCGFFSAERNMETIGNVPIIQVKAQFIDRQLSLLYIYFPRIGFREMTAAISQKYGPATTLQTARYQNGLGAQFESLVMTWDGAKAQLMATEMSETFMPTGAVSRDSSELRLVDKALNQKAQSLSPAGKPDI